MTGRFGLAHVLAAGLIGLDFAARTARLRWLLAVARVRIGWWDSLCVNAWADVGAALTPFRVGGEPAAFDMSSAKASGPSALRCYRLGSGPFAEGALATGLDLVFKPGSTNAGNVVPVASMTVAEFQNDLAATRSDWVVDEA